MSRGFTLLEVVVALLLLELGVLGAVGTLTVASRQLGEAERIERIVTEAEGILDSLAGTASPESGSREVAEAVIEWTVGGGGTITLRATGADGRSWLAVISAAARP